MAQVHWWLVAVAFALGLVLTLAMSIRPTTVRARVWTPIGGFTAPPRPAPAKRPGPAKRVPPHKGQRPSRPVGKGVPAKKVPARKGAPTKRIPAGKSPATARIPRVGERPTERLALTVDAVTERIPVAKDVARNQVPRTTHTPYGPGSARADADGSGPEGWVVKGRSDTRLYYTPEDPSYDPVIAQVWFENEEVAARAFFTPWRKSTQRK